MKLTGALLGALVLLCVFAALSFYKNGETISTMSGEVQKCEVLGGGEVEPLFHATIKTEHGRYVIASLSNCSPGDEVIVSIKRGALYLNTVYAADKI